MHSLLVGNHYYLEITLSWASARIKRLNVESENYHTHLKFHHGRISILTPDHFGWKKNNSRIKFPVTVPTTWVLLYSGWVPHTHIHLLKFKKNPVLSVDLMLL